MNKRTLPEVELRLDAIIGGGQALGTMPDGMKVLVWGGLPGELVKVRIVKTKSRFAEGVVCDVLQPSPERTPPRDLDSFLSTSPWQIMAFDAEQRHKAALIEEAFRLHDIDLPGPVNIYTDHRQFEYRNKIEFSFWWDNDTASLDLAFFTRGSHGKIPIEGTSLAAPVIVRRAQALRDVLRARGEEAFRLKTAIVRASQTGDTVIQLYVKDQNFDPLTDAELAAISAQGFELIYSDPKSPASVVSARLQEWGKLVLSDTILGVPFTYVAESFFQVNVPVYEQALGDIRTWVDASRPALDLYSGTGTLGLSVTTGAVTLVEINEAAVREAHRTIRDQRREHGAKAVLSSSEAALDYITPGATVIVDPPRAGLHTKVIERLMAVRPPRIIYLSCNPVTQARDIAMLLDSYSISAHKGYNFFPRTPHIEHLVVLDTRA